MKYLLGLFVLILVGAGCSANKDNQIENSTVTEEPIVIESNVTEPEVIEVKEVWGDLINTALDTDCEEFNQFLDKQVQQTQVGCDIAFSQFEKGVPKIDWTKSEVKNGEVTIFIKDVDIPMTVFKKSSNGIWLATTVFWPKKESAK